MIRSPSAVLFDLDGTLLDTANDLANCLNLLLSEEKKPTLPLDAIRLHVSNGANAMLDFGFGAIEESYKQNLRERLLKLYEANIATHTVWFDGLEAFTSLLREKGIPWGIVTNKPRLYTDLLLDAMQISSVIDVVVCPDDLNIAKPDPRPMLHACQQISAEPSSCVYVGDHIRDIEAGKAAGMKTIAAAYGYLEAPEQVYEWQADFIINKSTDISQLFDL
ncbi:HAD family hydrolase [Oceanospirillum sanctuarii]|uniref:HAD family hydrolase n=1 Tax=Oceanospirillum sanctuarii TaxID=1434821 RepID=UPI000A35EA6E|nr:HAD-IA family hydrolase [Oceanospirillum sanctuarii]